MTKPRHKATEFTSYLWDKVPRDLIQRAIEKGKQQTPPISLKWKLIELLRNWVEAD
jgi:hypothetical protein